MSDHGQPLVPSLAALHRLEGRRIDEARLTRIDEHGDEVELTLYLDDGSTVRIGAEEIEAEDPDAIPTGIVGAYLTVEVVG